MTRYFQSLSEQIKKNMSRKRRKMKKNRFAECPLSGTIHMLYIRTRTDVHMLLYSIYSQLIMPMTLLLLTLLSKWLHIDYRRMCVRHTNHTFTHYRMGHLPELAEICIASSWPLAITYHMVLVCIC